MEAHSIFGAYKNISGDKKIVTDLTLPHTGSMIVAHSESTALKCLYCSQNDTSIRPQAQDLV